MRAIGCAFLNHVDGVEGALNLRADRSVAAGLSDVGRRSTMSCVIRVQNSDPFNDIYATISEKRRSRGDTSASNC